MTDPYIDPTTTIVNNLLEAYESQEADRRLPPSGTWPSILHSWEKRTTMPEWHALRDCPTYNLRFTVTADRDYTVFSEATTSVMYKADGRLRMECVAAAQICRAAGITKEAFREAASRDQVFEEALDTLKVTPLRIRGQRSRVPDVGNGVTTTPSRKPRWWINEITLG